MVAPTSLGIAALDISSSRVPPKEESRCVSIARAALAGLETPTEVAALIGNAPKKSPDLLDVLQECFILGAVFFKTNAPILNLEKGIFTVENRPTTLREKISFLKYFLETLEDEGKILSLVLIALDDPDLDQEALLSLLSIPSVAKAASRTVMYVTALGCDGKIQKFRISMPFIARSPFLRRFLENPETKIIELQEGVETHFLGPAEKFQNYADAVYNRFSESSPEEDFLDLIDTANHFEDVKLASDLISKFLKKIPLLSHDRCLDLLCHLQKARSQPLIEEALISHLTKLGSSLCDKDVLALFTNIANRLGDSCEKIKDLDLSESKISQRTFEELSKLLPGIERLNISKTSISEIPTCLRKSLQELDASDCKLFKSIVGLKETGIKKLNVSRTNILLIPMGSWAKLEELNVSVCLKINSLDGLEMTGITVLNISGTSINRIPKGKWKNLKQVDISFCKKLTSISSLRSTGIEDLNISSSGINEIPVETPWDWKKLKKFNASFCKDFTSMCGLQNIGIKVLNISHTVITEIPKGPWAGLEELDASSCNYLKSIDGLQNTGIKTLNISDTQISKIPLGEWKGLKTLKALSCSSLTSVDGLVNTRINEVYISDKYALRVPRDFLSDSEAIVMTIITKDSQGKEKKFQLTNLFTKRSSLLKRFLEDEGSVLEEISIGIPTKKFQNYVHVVHEAFSKISVKDLIDLIDIADFLEDTSLIPELTAEFHVKVKDFSQNDCIALLHYFQTVRQPDLTIELEEVLMRRLAILNRSLSDQEIFSFFTEMAFTNMGNSLKQIRVLDLSKSQISEETLEKLSKLFPNIERLDVSGAEIAVISGSWKNLKRLKASCRSLTSIEGLQNTAIQILDISYSSVSIIPEGPWAALEKLDAFSCKSLRSINGLQNTDVKTLCISESNISMIPEGPWRGLEKLEASSCERLTSIWGLQNTGIKVLNISYSAITVIPEGPWLALDEINAFSCKKLASIEGLQKTGIKTLNISGTAVAVIPVGKWQGLKMLDASLCCDLHSIQGLQKTPLIRLNISSTKVTEIPEGDWKGLKTLEALSCHKLVSLDGLQHTGIQILNISGSNIDRIPEGDWKGLTKLDATYCYRLTSIEGLERTGIKILDISGSAVTEILKGSWPGLEELKAHACDRLVSIEGLQHTGIKKLDISGEAKEGITETVVDELFPHPMLWKTLGIPNQPIPTVQVTAIHTYCSLISSIPVGPWRALEEIDVSSALHLTSIEGLQHTGIQRLNISQTPVDKIPIGPWKKIETIHAFDCKRLTSVEGLELTDIKKLFLSGSNVTKIPESGWEKLEELKDSDRGFHYRK